MQTTLQKIFQEYKGILAADERPSSMDKRLRAYNIEDGIDARNRYRELLFSTPNLERTISAAILSEDTFSEHTTAGHLTREYLRRMGILVGVKVDDGLEAYDGAEDLYITKGLEHLNQKCKSYAKQGAEFVKWRSVIPVRDVPEAFLTTMAETMAAYANTALKHDLIPIIEPEVLLEGNHDIDEAASMLERTVTAVLAALKRNDCNPHRCILKTSFAVPGLACEAKPADIVAARTLEAFKKIGLDNEKSFYGIVFLSGGLPSHTAIEYIQRIRAIAEEPNTPHTFRPPLTFSYGRALQEPALAEWKGRDDCIYAAQISFTQTLQHAIKKYKGIEIVPEAGAGGEE